jgi:hypothetical protein
MRDHLSDAAGTIIVGVLHLDTRGSCGDTSFRSLDGYISPFYSLVPNIDWSQ